eukprot:m.148176 g.148176  ORF g.148176 m.148176 type:complete len:412 (-) comp17797_c0_seq1:130-1365(-)
MKKAAQAHRSSGAARDGEMNALIRKDSSISSSCVLCSPTENTCSDCQLSLQRMSSAVRTAVTIAVGCIFGIAIYKSSVYRVDILRAQFSFRCNVMLKVFLSGTAVSTMVLAILHRISDPNVLKAETGALKNRFGAPAVILGGMCLGTGMFLSGACPGTLAAQLGSGNIAKGSVTLLGALTAVAFVTLFDKRLRTFVEWGNFTKGHPNRLTVSGMLYGDSDDARVNTGVILAMVLALVVGLVDFLSPGFGELQPTDVIGQWNPIVCGIIIGSLQLPLMLVCGSTVGSSGAYSVLLGCLALPCRKILPAKIFDSLNSPLQLVYLASAALVVLVAAHEFSNRLRTAPFPYAPEELQLWQSYVGGFLALFGSRLAGGCTSGHGISGAGYLRVKSYLAVASMFGGGCLTAYIMQHV